eukprot:UN00860
MLGDSFMCDSPVTRVYSYGLYLSKNVLEPEFQERTFDNILWHSPDVAKTLRIEVTVTKNFGHWAGGFRKTLGKRLKVMGDFKKYEE